MIKTTPSFTGYLSHVKYYQKLEKSVHCNNNELHKFQTRWSTYVLI